MRVLRGSLRVQPAPRQVGSQPAVRQGHSVPVGRRPGCAIQCTRRRDCAFTADMYATKEAATAPSAKVLRLTEMGFDAATAQKALFEADGDENLALEKLLG